MSDDPKIRRGGWIAGSVLWGWIPVTFFAGLARRPHCRTLSVEVKEVDTETDTATT